MASTKDYLHLHFIVWIWGFTAILGHLISIPSVELVIHRTWIAALFLGLIVYARKKSFRIGWKSVFKIMLTGGLIALHWILFFASAKVSTISVCLAGMATASLWTSLLEPLIAWRKIRFFEILLGFVIIAGLYIVFLFEFNHIIGLIMAVLSAFIGALFTVINSRLIIKHNHYVITFYEMSGAFIVSLAILPLFRGYFQQPIELIPQGWDWLYIFILASICTVYAYTASVKLMSKFTAFAINLTVNLEPVYGILLAFLLFGDAEKMTSGFYIGTLIILFAVLSYPYLARYFSKTQKKKKESLKKQKIPIKPVLVQESTLK